ncbi:hypothetical protein [Pandoraea thiooxydans]|uniref:hypothetical protein n=1 Tax=Pandoraea thiooxydans TaxID=445709 RepID=UPI00147166A6|nr:hypothetical protein [Pandoraea thiooxydans]
MAVTLPALSGGFGTEIYKQKANYVTRINQSPAKSVFGAQWRTFAGAVASKA